MKFLDCAKIPTAKAFAKNVFINQERRLGYRKTISTVVVLTVNYADSDSVDAHFTGSIGAVREIKVFGFWGSMVERLIT